ncbi:hypothetical protein ES703_124329 [subsurface metagenome]
MVKTHKEVIRKALADVEVQREYEALELEYELRRVLLHLRREMHITQEELAKRLRTKQEYISRIECGHVDLTLSYFARLLHAMGADMEISLRPKDSRKVIKTRIPVA